MDPVAVFGIASGTLQTIHVLGHTLQNLWTLREKYTDADNNILSLINQLKTVQLALGQLNEFANRQGSRFPDCPDYFENLKIAVEGSQETVEALSAEIQRVVSCLVQTDGGPVLDGPLGFRTKLKVVWNGPIMEEHSKRMYHQVSALKLLLQVCHSQNTAEQLNLLRQETTKRLIKTVADDTATLRSAKSAARSVTDPSVMSLRSGRSSIGGTEFDFDDDVVNSVVYRSVFAQHIRSISDNAPGQKSSVSRQPSQATSRGLDEGYASASGTLRSTSPTRHTQNLRLETSFDTLHATSPVERLSPLPIYDNLPRSKTTSLARASSMSYLKIPRSKSDAPDLRKSSGSKRDLVRSAIKRMNSSRQLRSGSLSGSSAAADARPPKRDPSTDLKTSIDISSPSGVMAPPIVKAAQSGALAQVEVYIKKGVNIDSFHEESGRTALAVAAHCGKRDVVNLLLENKANSETFDSNRQTPLHLAASRGYKDVIERLLEEHVDVEARDSLGRTPFWIAVEHRHVDVAKLLLDSGSKINTRAKGEVPPLHVAARLGDVLMVSLLLRHSKIDIDAKDAELKTALHYACEAGQTPVAEQLLSRGAAIEARGARRATPLICAAVMGRPRTIDLLLKKGANISAADEEGLSALHWAAFHGHNEIVNLLVKKKASTTSTTMLGRTPLHLATLAGQFATVELLVRGKPPLEVRCKEGFTPLHYACRKKHANIVRLLLDAGANVEADVVRSGRRAIHLAVEAGSFELCSILQSHRADLNCTDDAGWTPLCIACCSGQAKIVQWLLVSEVSPRAIHTDHDHGVSPICLATAEGNLDAVSLLLLAGVSPSECDENGWNSLIYAAHYGQYEILEYLLQRSDLSAKQSLVTLFFQLGFVPNIQLSNDVRQKVTALIVQLRSDLINGTVQGGLPGIGPPMSPYQQVFTRPASYIPQPQPTRHGWLVQPQELASTAPLFAPGASPSAQNVLNHIFKQPGAQLENRHGFMAEKVQRVQRVAGESTESLTRGAAPVPHITPSVSPEIPDITLNGLDFRVGDFPSHAPLMSNPTSVDIERSVSRLETSDRSVGDNNQASVDPAATQTNTEANEVPSREREWHSADDFWEVREVQASASQPIVPGILDDILEGEISDVDSVATFSTAPESADEVLRRRIELYELE